MKKLLLVSILFLAGCANMRMISVRPGWNPPQGQEWAEAQCQARASVAGGYDWVDSVVNRGKAYRACMASYGYELCRVDNK
jgi:hypothetical protein